METKTKILPTILQKDFSKVVLNGHYQKTYFKQEGRYMFSPCTFRQEKIQPAGIL